MYVFKCYTDAAFCLSFSEKLFMQMADRIAEDGFQKAGYEYVCIDVSGKLDTFAITVEPCIMATLLLQPLY